MPIETHGSEPPEMASGPPGRWSVALSVGLVIVLVALVVVAWAGLQTASARLAGRTDNESSEITAAVIDVQLGVTDDFGQELVRFNGAGLHPDLVVETCVQVRYQGSLDAADTRLSGGVVGGTGLESYLVATLEEGTGVRADCGDFEPGRSLFSGDLADLATAHGDWERGLGLTTPAGEATTVRLAVTVESDNRAQGLDTDFVLDVEARP